MVLPLSWTDSSISGAEGLDDRAVVAAIDAGARVVKLEMVCSLALSYYVGSHLYLVRPGESWARVAAVPTAVTLLAGWWGIAVVYVPVALWHNLRGGVEVTRAVRAERLARAEAAEAAAQAEEQALAAETSGSVEEREAAALARLKDGEVETAYRLLEGTLGRGGPLDRDLTTLRRLVTGLHDQRLWTAAGRAVDVLQREFPDEARKGYLASVVRRIRAELDAGTPDRWVPPPPVWQTPRGLAAIVSALLVLAAMGVIALNTWIAHHRTLHVVNGTQDPVVVEVAGAVPPRVDLAPGRRATLVVSEGDLVTRVERRGAEARRAHVLRGDFFERFRPGAVVLNVEGAALLVLEEAVFAGRRAHPRAPAPARSLFGDELVVVPWVHHVFEAFPTSLPTKTETGSETRRRLDVLGGTPMERVVAMPDGTPERALDYLELHLRLAPEDPGTLAEYVALVEAVDARERGAAFLRAGGPAWEAAAQRLAPR